MRSVVPRLFIIQMALVFFLGVLVSCGTKKEGVDAPSQGMVISTKDSDNDGLKDVDEKECHSNPQALDTDADGLTDFEECRTYLTNPVEGDTDGDTVSDFDEIKDGSDPFERDHDKDGIPSPADCNDNDSNIFPGNTDEVDGFDRNCVIDKDRCYEAMSGVNTGIVDRYLAELTNPSLVSDGRYKVSTEYFSASIPPCTTPTGTLIGSYQCPAWVADNFINSVYGVAGSDGLADNQGYEVVWDQAKPLMYTLRWRRQVSPGYPINECLFGD